MSDPYFLSTVHLYWYPFRVQGCSAPWVWMSRFSVQLLGHSAEFLEGMTNAWPKSRFQYLKAIYLGQIALCHRYHTWMNDRFIWKSRRYPSEVFSSIRQRERSAIRHEVRNISYCCDSLFHLSMDERNSSGFLYSSPMRNRCPRPSHIHISVPSHWFLIRMFGKFRSANGRWAHYPKMNDSIGNWNLLLPIHDKSTRILHWIERLMNSSWSFD